MQINSDELRGLLDFENNLRQSDLGKIVSRWEIKSDESGKVNAAVLIIHELHSTDGREVIKLQGFSGAYALSTAVPSIETLDRIAGDIRQTYPRIR